MQTFSLYLNCIQKPYISFLCIFVVDTNRFYVAGINNDHIDILYNILPRYIFRLKEILITWKISSLTFIPQFTLHPYHAKENDYHRSTKCILDIKMM